MTKVEKRLKDLEEAARLLANVIVDEIVSTKNDEKARKLLKRLGYLED